MQGGENNIAPKKSSIFSNSPSFIRRSSVLGGQFYKFFRQFHFLVLLHKKDPEVFADDFFLTIPFYFFRTSIPILYIPIFIEKNNGIIFYLINHLMISFFTE